MTGYKATCTQNDPPQTPTLNWSVSNATGVAVSVDDSTNVGSYGTYSQRSGSAQMPAIGCGGDRGSTTTHRYDVYTIGGADGQRSHRRIYVSVTVN